MRWLLSRIDGNEVRYIPWLGLIFVSLSFFDLYRYTLEPLGIHHLVAHFFPEWFAEFSGFYETHFPEQRDRYVVMVLSAKMLGFFSGFIVSLTFVFKKYDRPINFKVKKNNALPFCLNLGNWGRVELSIFCALMFMLFLFIFLGYTFGLPEFSSSRYGRFIHHSGIFTFAHHFFGTSIVLFMLVASFLAFVKLVIGKKIILGVNHEQSK